MHRSEMRFGGEPPLLESEPRRASGPVRVRYFDPRTGEPCDAKPEPLRKAPPAPPTSTAERNAASARRAAAEREGAEIAARVDARRGGGKAKRKGGGRMGAPGRPVVVDGKFYPTVRQAAERIGCALSTVANRCRAGGGKVKGHDVRYVDDLARGRGL